MTQLAAAEFLVSIIQVIAIVPSSSMAPGEQTTPASGDAPLDVNILKEIAKKDLVDALNSVRPSLGVPSSR